MKQIDESTRGGHSRIGTRISRRVAMGSAASALLCVLPGSAFAQGQQKNVETRRPPREIQERMEQSRAFSERMRNAGSMEERMKIMEERTMAERRRAVEDLKEQLGVSDKEWAVVGPRLEAVYNLVHPLPQFGRRDAPPRTEIQQKSSELRELLRNQKAPVDQIKAKLGALRSAKEKARQELATAQQSLRQLMTLRQEAVLVLNGLLD
jgi:flagellar motility protein MotE (MotC chaperone)